MATMKLILEKVLGGEKLSRQETKDILLGITRDEYPSEQISALLTALQMRGVTVDELLGFRDGILETGVHKKLCTPVNLFQIITQTHSRACLKNKSCTKHTFPRPFS